MDSGQVRGALLALALVLIVGFGAMLVLRPVLPAPAIVEQVPVIETAPAPAPAPAAAFTPAPAAPAPAPISPPVIAASAPRSLEDVIAGALPAVVSIQAGASRGTGFFVSPDRVLTNHHVIDGQSFVELTSGTAKYSARVASVSPGADLAVLQVTNPNPQQAVLRLGSASAARPGQEVVAVGSALGVLANTVTRGIVSAVRRAGEITLLQTDAAINPGNSGGPLLDRTGTVIGVNSMTVASRVGQGLAFAVAIDHAADLLNGRGARATSTPLQALNQTMSGQTEAEMARTRAGQQYAQVVAAAAQRGAALDQYWEQGAQLCVTSAVNAGDRPWFAVLEPNGVTLAPLSAYNCPGWLETLRSNADQLRAAIDDAAETARRAGVFPGVMRDARRRARMDW
ncbi:MAG: S1C family serine protease, partial [Vicinamibacterales bacterium]